MNLRERIKKELEIQKSIEPLNKFDEKLILTFLGCCQSEQQFFNFVNVVWYRKPNDYSYNGSCRFYYPKQELINFVKKVVDK